MNYEFMTAIDYDDEFHVNLLFDHSILNLIYRPMCSHMGYYRPVALSHLEIFTDYLFMVSADYIY